MGRYVADAGRLRYAPPPVRLAVVGIIAVLLAAVCILPSLPCAGSGGAGADVAFVAPAGIGWTLLVIGIITLAAAIIIGVSTTDAKRIGWMARRGLCDPAWGNPLNLRDGEMLPRIRCKRAGEGRYVLTVSCSPGVTAETIADVTSAVSAALARRYQRYAVVLVDTDPAMGWVAMTLDDVTTDRSLTITDVGQLRPSSPTLLRVDQVTIIDLTTSGSMLVAGKTRSGKTTGIISLLLQVLLAGRDSFNGEVVIIDPKQAELSRLPHTVTLDADGEARPILAALRRYCATITYRQQTLNNLSVELGDAVHWWDADMHPSFIVIDEYVALRALLPKRPGKDDDYCVDTFDGLVKRIVTMGASAGCYAVISIAEASVVDGGLPAMLRSAMSTRILFRPTRAEGLLIWDKEKLEPLPERVYGPGDAWFSSTDGIHDAVTTVHFPILKIPAYAELGRLLRRYYGD